MEPLGPSSLQQHDIQNLQKPQKPVNWEDMAKAAEIQALANNILQSLKRTQHLFKQQQ